MFSLLMVDYTKRLFVISLQFSIFFTQYSTLIDHLSFAYIIVLPKTFGEQYFMLQLVHAFFSSFLIFFYIFVTIFSLVLLWDLINFLCVSTATNALCTIYVGSNTYGKIVYYKLNINFNNTTRTIIIIAYISLRL